MGSVTDVVDRSSIIPFVHTLIHLETSMQRKRDASRYVLLNKKRQMLSVRFLAKENG